MLHEAEGLKPVAFLALKSDSMVWRTVKENPDKKRQILNFGKKTLLAIGNLYFQ